MCWTVNLNCEPQMYTARYSSAPLAPTNLMWFKVSVLCLWVFVVFKGIMTMSIYRVCRILVIPWLPWEQTRYNKDDHQRSSYKLILLYSGFYQNIFLLLRFGLVNSIDICLGLRVYALCGGVCCLKWASMISPYQVWAWNVNQKYYTKVIF